MYYNDVYCLSHFPDPPLPFSASLKISSLGEEIGDRHRKSKTAIERKESERLEGWPTKSEEVQQFSPGNSGCWQHSSHSIQNFSTPSPVFSPSSLLLNVCLNSNRTSIVHSIPFTVMAEKRTLTKVLKTIGVLYIVVSLFYATAHLLGLTRSTSGHSGKFLSNRSNTKVQPMGVAELQQRYQGNQRVVWSNGKN